MGAPADIISLVERFQLHRASYQTAQYNETQLRREFVDPFFKALGWDVDNEQGYAEAYKEVIHEDALKIGGSTKAPDYCFRVGPTRKFFVETKKPSVNLKQDPEPAYQLRRYAWSAKLPLSILTDFEEFAVYNCRARPGKNDKASKERTLYIRCEEFADRWDEIASIFSREAVYQGSFDKYAETKKKRGTAEVDDAFLREIESWREMLARNLALRNPDLSQRALNYAVQKTIDRIIFLRICEDRGIERMERLRGLTNSGNIYARLCEIFREADVRYNSGLFHFQQEKGRPDEPDEWTLGLAIDDKLLKEIIGGLYYPDCPYEFSVLPADILGQVYEQFLGKVIRLTKGGRAKVEDKPEVKKAGGVYYTPTYIVDYIVQNTVGKLLEGKTPQQVGGLTKTWRPSKTKRPLAILDPACGSGSFLIGAYQYLLDWHLQWYTENEPARHLKRRNPPIWEAPRTDPETPNYRLTTWEKKRILVGHIYGVDIDPQAVEVTKLSLLLKVLEGETRETLQRQLFAKQRALPDLGNNIKCGNSLIGPDFYEGRQGELFDEEELLRINAFDWHAEFPHIFPTSGAASPTSRDRQGADKPLADARGSSTAAGFDAVIGNPPYVRMEMFKEIKDYLRQRYACHAERTDLYVYFIEKEHELLRPKGRFGMIVSNKFIRAKYGEPVRRQLRETACIEHIVDLAGLPVFRGATVRTVVLISRRAKAEVTGKGLVMYSPPLPREEFSAVEGGTKPLSLAAAETFYAVERTRLNAEGWCLLRPEHADLRDRLQQTGVPLKEFTQGRICMGIKSGLTAAFVITPEQREAILARNPEAAEIIHPFLQGRQIRRYHVEPVSEYLIYTQHGIEMKPYPAVIEHLRPFRKRLEKRATKQNWYELQQPQYAYVDYLKAPKIVFPDIATGCRFALDTEGRFGANTVYFIPLADPALLGLLNSRLAFFFFQQTCAALEGPGEAYLRFFGQYLENFPVRLPPEGDPQRTRLTELVNHTLSLHHQLQQAKTGHQHTALKRQIDVMDQDIDWLVYKLYDMTEDEIHIITGATS